MAKQLHDVIPMARQPGSVEMVAIGVDPWLSQGWLGWAISSQAGVYSSQWESGRLLGSRSGCGVLSPAF